MTSGLQHEINGVIDDMDNIYALAASKAGLSQSAFEILYALAVYGDGCTQKELCERCYTGKQTINSSVKRLEAQGFVLLEPGRGRETLVTLTEEGHALVAEKISPFVRAEEASYDVLDEREQETLLRLISRMRDALRASLESSGLL